MVKRARAASRAVWHGCCLLVGVGKIGSMDRDQVIAALKAHEQDSARLAC
jgi:hypothetical protein